MVDKLKFLKETFSANSAWVFRFSLLWLENLARGCIFLYLIGLSVGRAPLKFIRQVVYVHEIILSGRPPQLEEGEKGIDLIQPGPFHSDSAGLVFPVVSDGVRGEIELSSIHKVLSSLIVFILLVLSLVYGFGCNQAGQLGIGKLVTLSIATRISRLMRV